VAEAAGFPSESMDLFRHCTFLGGELESARGYANWALSTIRDMDKNEKVCDFLCCLYVLLKRFVQLFVNCI
jgi:hypothetical protein